MIFRFGSKFEGEMLSQVSQSPFLSLALWCAHTQPSPGSVKPMYTDLTEQINGVHSFIMKSRKMGKKRKDWKSEKEKKTFFFKNLTTEAKNSLTPIFGWLNSRNGNKRWPLRRIISSGNQWVFSILLPASIWHQNSQRRWNADDKPVLGDTLGDLKWRIAGSHPGRLSSFNI